MKTTSTTRWWHIRHAPVPDPHGIIYGGSDVLADVSDAAAMAAAASVLPEGAVWVVSSLQRTRQTAEALLAARPALADPASLIVEPDLREQSLGAWHGRVRAEVFAEMPRRHPFWISPAINRPPEGESFLDQMGRVQPVLERLSLAHAGRDVVCVTHGGTIRAALAMALRLDAETAQRFAIDNVSLSRVDRLQTDEGPYWQVLTVNKVLPPHTRHG